MTDKPEMILKELYDYMTQAYLNTCKELGDMRIRAEAAEQERDKLLKNIGAAQRALVENAEAMTYESVSKLLDMVLEGSKLDGK